MKTIASWLRAIGLNWLADKLDPPASTNRNGGNGDEV